MTTLAISPPLEPASPLDLERARPLSERLTPDYLEFYGLLPLCREGEGGEERDGQDDRVRVATWRDDVDPQAVDDLRLELGGEIDLVRGPEDELRAAIRRVYGVEPVTAETLIAGLGPGRTEAAGDAELPLDDLVQLANEAPVVKLVNLLLLEALEARASDVHLEGYADGLRVRYRVDGVLQDAPTPPEHLKPSLASRLKIMGGLDS